jgi:hypothetical protein
MRNSWVSKDGKMRWRTMAAEEMRWMEKQQQRRTGKEARVAEGRRQRRCHQQQTTITYCAVVEEQQLH